MTGSKATVAATDARIRRLAYRGRGMFTARALADAGTNSQALLKATRRGTAHPTGYRGVYSVFPPQLHSARDRLQAAWTAIDLTAPPWERLHHTANVVSHHTALALHANTQPAEPFEFVLGSRSRLIDRPGIIAHRQPIAADEITILDHLPVQTVGAAIVDLMRTYRSAPEQTVPDLLAATLRAGADPGDTPQRLGTVLANAWSRRDHRQFLANLFLRTGADPDLVTTAILSLDWHRIGFWRIQISNDANRAWITRLYIDAVGGACAALCSPTPDHGARDAERYLHRFADLTRQRVAFFDQNRQERIRLLEPPTTTTTSTGTPRATPLAGHAIDDARATVTTIAAQHHGIITTAEATRHGVTSQQLRTFVTEQLLHRTNNRGVYTTATMAPTGLDRLRAAWFAADTRTPMHERARCLRAVLVGPTAAALHAGQIPDAPYHLALGSKNRHIRRADVIAYRSREITPADVVVRHDMTIAAPGVDLHLGASTPPAANFDRLSPAPI